jgi:uncharacterized protein YeeX (DUF496 family)
LYGKIPDINKQRKDEQMKDLDQNIQELVATAKITALYKVKNKIQEEIDELEKKVGDDEIPF